MTKIMFDLEEIKQIIECSPREYNPDTKYRYEYLEFNNNTISLLKREDIGEGECIVSLEAEGITDIVDYLEKLENKVKELEDEIEYIHWEWRNTT